MKKVLLIIVVLLVPIFWMSISGWLPWGGAPWFINGPERLRVENHSGQTLNNIKILETVSGKFEIINELEANGIETVRMHGGQEPHYKLIVNIDGKQHETYSMYTETGECVIYSIEKTHVTDRLEDFTDSCFWF